MEPLIRSRHRARPLELDQFDRGTEAVSTSCMFAVQMDLAEFREAPPLSFGDTGSDSLEVAIVRQKDAAAILSNLSDQWIGRVGRQNVAQPGHQTASILQNFAGGFRHVIVGEKPQWRRRAQAASFIRPRTMDTSNGANVGYSIMTAASDKPALMKLSMAVTGMRVPAITRAL